MDTGPPARKCKLRGSLALPRAPLSQDLETLLCFSILDRNAGLGSTARLSGLWGCKDVHEFTDKKICYRIECSIANDPVYVVVRRRVSERIKAPELEL